jgi:hypothetical protein
MPDSREPGLKLSDAGGVNHLHAADRALPVLLCPTPSPVARQEGRSRAPADRVEQIQAFVIRRRATPLDSECCTPSAPAPHAGVERWRCGPNFCAQTHAASLALLFACKGAEQAGWPARWRGRGTIPLLPGGALPGSRLVLVSVLTDYSRHPWLSARSPTRVATTSDRTQASSRERRQCLDSTPGRSEAQRTRTARAQPHADANALPAEWIAYAVVIQLRTSRLT